MLNSECNVQNIVQCALKVMQESCQVYKGGAVVHPITYTYNVHLAYTYQALDHH